MDDLKVAVREAAEKIADELRPKLGWRPGPEPKDGTWWWCAGCDTSADADNLGVELEDGSMALHLVRQKRWRYTNINKRPLVSGPLAWRVSSNRILEALKPMLTIKPGEWMKLRFEGRVDNHTKRERTVIKRAQQTQQTGARA